MLFSPLGKMFWAAIGSVHGLLRALCSEINPCGACVILLDAKDWTSVDHSKVNALNFVLPLFLSCSLLLIIYLLCCFILQILYIFWKFVLCLISVPSPSVGYYFISASFLILHKHFYFNLVLLTYFCYCFDFVHIH